jgi:predicted kinase
LHAEPWQAAYSPKLTERVYAELLASARVVLESGRSVVLDATFSSRAWREAARGLARATGAVFSFVECRASEAVARARLAARARGPSVSDGRTEIYADLAARYEPVTELPHAEHVAIATSGTLDASLQQLERAGLASPRP